MFILMREPYADDATLGTMATPFGNFFILERPWLDNQRGKSCIPEGDYECRKRWSPHFKRHLYGVMDVPGRGDILIHSGSYIEHSLGCLLLGLTTFTIKTADGSKRGIGLSRVAVDKLHDAMQWQPFTLSIRRK